MFFGGFGFDIDMLGMFIAAVIFKMIHACAGIALFAHGDQVGELVGVSGRLPHHRVHQNRAVQADHIVPHLNHGFPPGIADISLQFRSQRAVIVAGRQSAIDFAGLKDKSPPLTERHNIIKFRQFRHNLFLSIGLQISYRIMNHSIVHILSEISRICSI